METGDLLKFVIEFYKPGAANAAARWDFPIRYDGADIDQIWIDTDFLQGSVAKAARPPAGCIYRVLLVPNRRTRLAGYCLHKVSRPERPDRARGRYSHWHPGHHGIGDVLQMITTEEAFEEFRRRLELSETERQNTIKRHNEVRDVIRSDFAVDRDLLTGSHRRHTKTKPLKDVDVFFVLSQKERDQYRSKPPADLINAFVKSLRVVYGDDAVEPGRRCATVEFERNTKDKEGKVLSIDAVPAFELGDCYEIPDRVRGDWVKTDPEIHMQEATAKNKELGGKWIPLVKMVKRWNRSADKPIKPAFLIEVMMQELVDAPFTTYPSEVRRFFASALGACPSNRIFEASVLYTVHGIAQ